jgi:hypothetical protein
VIVVDTEHLSPDCHITLESHPRSSFAAATPRCVHR